MMTSSCDLTVTKNRYHNIIIFIVNRWLTYIYNYMGNLTFCLPAFKMYKKYRTATILDISPIALKRVW